MNGRIQTWSARSVSLLIAMLTFVPCLRSQGLPAQVRVLETRLDLGPASPGIGHEARTTLSIVVVSQKPWSLSASILPGSASNFDRSLKLRDNTGNWVNLRQGVPVPLATGTATLAAGQLMTFGFEFAPTWDQAPGVQELQVRFSLSDGTTFEDMRIVARIDAATAIMNDVRDYSVSVPDPSRPGLLPFEKVTYRVTSNAPWRLVARLDDVPKVAGSSVSLRNDALVVKVDGVNWVPVPVAKTGIPVTTGGATGAPGVPVQVEFAIRTNASEIGGRYSAPLEIVAEPMAAPRPN